MAGQVCDCFLALDPASAGGGSAELAAHLSPLLAVPPEAVDGMLARLPRARLLRLLEAPEAAPLRARFRLDGREELSRAVAVAHAAIGAGQAGSLAALAEALCAHRRAALPQARLAATVEAAKARLVACWSCALDRIVPAHGAVDAAVSRRLGLSSEVHAALCADLGIARDGAIPRADFHDALPRLVRFWPLTEEGLATLEALERVAASTLAHVGQTRRDTARRGAAVIVPLDARSL